MIHLPTSLTTSSAPQLKTSLARGRAAHSVSVFIAGKPVELGIEVLRALKILGTPTRNADEYTFVTTSSCTLVKTNNQEPQRHCSRGPSAPSN